MTDEIAQPERNIPLVMVISNTLSGVMAFFAAVVYMFCVVNIDNLSNPIGGEPIVQLMYDSFQSRGLTTVGVICLILTFVGSSYMYYTSTSRLIWSFAQSDGLPFSGYLGQVSSKLKSPVNALTLLTVLCIIIGTLIMGSDSALNAVLGTSMVCINLSYLIPIACLLVKTRCSWNRYDIKPYFCLGKFGFTNEYCFGSLDLFYNGVVEFPNGISSHVDKHELCMCCAWDNMFHWCYFMVCSWKKVLRT